MNLGPARRFLAHCVGPLEGAFPIGLGSLAGLGVAMFSARAIWIVALGPRYEFDSLTYLLDWAPYGHGPAYAVLIRSLAAAGAGAHGVALAQCAAFAIGAALFCAHFGRCERERWLLSAMLAVEPATSFLGTDLMSETLFLALLLPWLALISHYASRRNHAVSGRMVPWIALIGAMLYATRLVAAIFPGYFALVAWVRGGLGRALVHTLLLVACTELFLVPVKLAYLKRYDTYSLSVYGPKNLWNSASPLWPDSSLRARPRTEFERYLATRDPNEFTTWNALQTHANFDETLALSSFLAQHSITPEFRREFDRELYRTASDLILENPLGFVRRFVLPNYVQPLSTNEEVAPTKWVDDEMLARLGFVQSQPVRYSSAVWRFYFAVLVGASVLELARSRGGTAARVLLGFSWFYLLLLPWFTALFLRFVLVLVPGIVIAAFRIVAGPARRSSTTIS